MKLIGPGGKRDGESPLVLIHGWCGSKRNWDDLLPHLTGCATMPVDLPGHGDRPLDVAGPATIAGFGRWLVGHLADEGVMDPILVGHSLGGAVALEAAAMLGERCRLVMGIDTFTDAAMYDRRPEPEIAARLAAFAETWPTSLESLVEMIVLAGDRERLSAAITTEMVRCPKERALAVMGELLRWDIGETIAKVRCPVVTINSLELEPLLQLRPLDAVAVRHIEGGHFPMNEVPESLALAMRAVLG